MFAIRSDLFEQAGLALPSRFDEVIAAGRALHSPKFDRVGIVWDASRGAAVATTFRTLLVGAGAFTKFDPLRVPTRPPEHSISEFVQALRGDKALQTLEFLRQLVEISPPDILDMAWNRSIEVFMRGQAGMYFGWSNYLSRAEYDPRSIVRHRIKYLTQPTLRGGVMTMPLSGYTLAIPANVSDQRAGLAAEAIKWLISTGVDGHQLRSGMPMAPRFDNAVDPETRPGARVQQFIQKLADKRQLQTRYRPIGPDFLAIEEILGNEIHAALSKQKTSKAALGDAADQIAQKAQNKC